MVEDPRPKSWDPARFTYRHTHGSGDGAFGTDVVKQHTVVILNNPLENKTLLVDVCVEGEHHTKARVLGIMAHLIHQSPACCIVCADGGANRLHDLHLAGKEEKTCVCR